MGMRFINTKDFQYSLASGELLAKIIAYTVLSSAQPYVTLENKQSQAHCLVQ
jgi:hypothetical protein